MTAIAITGGIGAGKSASAEFIRSLGFPLIDTDDVAREVVALGSEGLQAVVREFGSEVLRPDGSLDRAAVGARVFCDSDSRLRLEGLLHPRIHAVWSAWLRDPNRLKAPITFVVIPLLFEKGYEKQFDGVVAVGCTLATQRYRLLNRGWTESGIESRLAAQLPMEEKLRRSRYVIWNEGDLGCLHDQWRRLISCWKSSEEPLRGSVKEAICCPA